MGLAEARKPGKGAYGQCVFVTEWLVSSCVMLCHFDSRLCVRMTQDLIHEFVLGGYETSGVMWPSMMGH